VTVQQITLKPHENPPGDVDHALVVQDTSGLVVVSGVVAGVDWAGDPAAKFWTGDSSTDLHEGINAAVDWAAKNGVGTIYVKTGVGRAAP
jgi:hypothetical protein